ncbi:thioredoxin domain-containing protein [Cronobacter dublinensis]|nr:thioredoxin domain-containing protein [Cronobacter dublinensis]
MTRTTLAALGAAFSLFAGSAAAVPAQAFTPEQEARTEKTGADNKIDEAKMKEFQAMIRQKLQLPEQKNPVPVVMANQEALLHDADTPAYGPAKAKVAVIEFLDYQCHYCYQMTWEIEKVMKTNPEVRFVFKPWTIYAGKWPSSEQAAQRGLAVWKAKGEQAYMRYHNRLFNTMHMNGELTTEDIDNAAMAGGFVANSIPDNSAALLRNDALAKQLGLIGAPALIIMPVTGATPDNITVLEGGETAEEIQLAIRKAEQTSQ